MNKFIATALTFFATISLASCASSGNKQSSNTASYGDSTDYSLSLKYINGNPIGDAVITITDANEKVVSEGTTSLTGSYSFNANAGEYNVSVGSMPLGYYIEETPKFTSDVKELDITAISKPISGDAPDGIVYKAKDIIYDFAFNDFYGNTISLGKTLKTKSLVVLNFWYSTCYWCDKEFPVLEEAYKEYKDSVSVFALNVSDNKATAKAYASNKGLTFDVGLDSEDIDSAFEKSGYPYSVFIDRYGRIDYIELGAISEKVDWTNKFAKYTANDYQVVETEDNDGPVKPNVEMPSSEAIANVVSGEGFDGTYAPETNPDDAEYSWPFVIDEEKQAIYPSNVSVNNSYAIMYVNVHLNENEVFAFDYFSSSEEGYDELYILVNSVIIQRISGISEDWKTSFTYVAIESANYSFGFCYMKDEEGYSGDDTVYLKNFRKLTVDDIDEPTYVLRTCAWGNVSKFTNKYEHYITPVYNESDGYYHVNSENGPLVLADFLGSTQFTGYALYDYAYNDLLNDVNGVNYKDIVLNYSYAASSSKDQLISVDKEMKDVLDKVCDFIASNSYEDPTQYSYYDYQWLEVCSYFSAYGTGGKEYEDPNVGLTFEKAIKAELGDQNFCTFDRIVMPRGLKFYFIAPTSGVYHFTTVGENETEGWLYNSERKQIERSESVLLRSVVGVENPDPNFNMWSYVNEGEKVYINAAFVDLYLFDTLQLKIELAGETHTSFELCSPGFFTTTTDGNGDMTSEIITGGKDVKLGNDGYYHVINDDKTLGSICYADFTMLNTLFQYTLKDMVKMGAFNCTVNEVFEPVEGGEDYTNEVKNYIMNKMILDDSEAFGTIPVDKRLAVILQAFMDKYTFKGIDHSWNKLCYYYRVYSK